MANWPAGHRWEDYQVRIYNKSWAVLGTLPTVHHLRGAVARWGQFGTVLTFSLEKNDPWVNILNEKEVHFVNIIRDGASIWGGYQVKMDREHDRSRDAEESWIEFEWLPLARIMGWRHGYESSANFMDVTGVKVDDGFKDIAAKTIGASAPNLPTSGLSLQLSGITIAGDKTEHPDDASFTGTGSPARQDIYEWMQERAALYDVDWDIYWNGDTPTFETWYPRRGVDRTEGNGSNTECIFNDTEGNIAIQSYGWDTADSVTGVHSADFTKDVVADTASRTAWLLRMRAVDANATTDLDTELANYAPVVWYEMREFRESEGKQWGTHFNIGDRCTWMSHEFGYGPYNETIGKIEFEIDQDGFEHLTLTLAEVQPDPPDNNNKMRGGGRRKRRVRYTDPQNPDEVGKHTVLNGDVHSDTVADTVSRGSLIYGNADAAWDELTVGSQYTALVADGTDVSFDYPYGKAFVQEGEPGTTWAGQIWVDIS